MPPPLGALCSGHLFIFQESRFEGGRAPSLLEDILSCQVRFDNSSSFPGSLVSTCYPELQTPVCFLSPPEALSNSGQACWLILISPPSHPHAQAWHGAWPSDFHQHQLREYGLKEHCTGFILRLSLKTSGFGSAGVELTLQNRERENQIMGNLKAPPLNKEFCRLAHKSRTIIRQHLLIKPSP